MASIGADDLLAGYPVIEGVYDEGFAADGVPRPWARAALEAVARADPASLPDRISRSLTRSGVRFSSLEGDLQFYVDPVPRVITAAEWEPVKRGLAQRVRALNAFVADVYGDQRIVAEGLVPLEVIRSADYFEPEMRGIKPPSGVWIGVAGLDIVRDATGEWLVLEDNVRTPSGFAYLHATRRALLEHIDDPAGRDAAAAGRRDRPARRRAARRRAGERPRPPRAAGRGPDRRRAQLGLLGARLARRASSASRSCEPRELELRGDHLWLRPRGLREDRRIDVIYRRTNADRLDSDLGRLLIEPVRRGLLGLVNQYGTGVADDKLTHAYVETMIRFYLGEEPVLRSVPTYDLAQPAQLEEALDVFDELVLKPRAGHGGVGVLIAPRATRDGDRGDARGGDRRPGRLDRAADGHALHASDRRRGRQVRAAPHRPAAVRVPRRGLHAARAAGRADARGARRGRAGGELVPERRGEGHLGLALGPSSRRRVEARERL